MSTNGKIYNSSNLSQQLNLAPQLFNWLKILQASSLDLSQMVQSELTTNPVLEETVPETDHVDADSCEFETGETSFDDSEMGERLSVLADIDNDWRDADLPSLSTGSALQEKHDFVMDHLVKAATLQDELAQIIQFADLSDKEREMAAVFVGSLNERGYLDGSVEEIAENTHETLETVQQALETFQKIAPAGIGARDLRECLILQLKAMKEDTELAQMLVAEYIDHMAGDNSDAVAEHLDVEHSDVDAAWALVRTLDPEPGRNYTTVAVEYVEADIEIFEKNGELQVQLLDERLPRLQISSYCKKLLEARQGTKEDLEYIRAKLRDANFLMQGISQRQETMLKVTRQIMNAQNDFLSSKEGELKPLTMNKVASIIGVHETTVSRAIANKYIRTSRGLVEMRAFFKTGYRCADGSSVTPEKVKEQIQVFISSEDDLKPLTDEHISERLKKQGLKVARRTVAKYREEMEIPSSKQRMMENRRSNSQMAAGM